MHTIGSALSKCAVCGYSLTGAPHDGMCAECGVRYDADSRAWYAHRWWLLDAILYVILAGGILGMFPAIFGWNYGLWNIAGLGLLAFSILLIAVSVVRYRGGDRPSIAMLPDGIYVRYSVLYRRQFRIPSARIRRVADSCGGNVDKVIAKLFGFELLMFDRDQVADFTHEVRRLLERIAYDDEPNRR